jgi:hypothetical protein
VLLQRGRGWAGRGKIRTKRRKGESSNNSKATLLTITTAALLTITTAALLTIAAPHYHCHYSSLSLLHSYYCTHTTALSYCQYSSLYFPHYGFAILIISRITQLPFFVVICYRRTIFLMPAPSLRHHGSASTAANMTEWLNRSAFSHLRAHILWGDIMLPGAGSTQQRLCPRLVSCLSCPCVQVHLLPKHARR